MTRVAVTGASGFVARHLIPRLVEQGHEVRGLARHSPDHTGSGGTVSGFRFTPGDVRESSTVRRLLDGCDALIHLAASFDPSEDAAGINVQGTESVVAQAKEAGIRRIVFLSCLGAQAAARSPFYQSKWRAEMIVKASRVPFTILLPSLIVGNGDGVIRPLADLIAAFPLVPVPGPSQPRLQPIDVADVCRCIVAALSEDALTGEMVSLGGPMFLTLRELIDLVAHELGTAKPKITLPDRFLPAITAVLPATARWLYAGPRLAQFRESVVTSPGIVPRMFGFEPGNVLVGLPTYLA